VVLTIKIKYSKDSCANIGHEHRIYLVVMK